MINVLFSSRARKIHRMIRRYRLMSRFLSPYSKTARLLGLFHLPNKYAKLNNGEALAQCLESLGPIFIKFGQSLSTRPDLFPKDIVLALAKLRDRIDPFPGEQAVAIVEKSLGKPIDKVFKEFNKEPLATASVAQVHSATLLNGDQVVVKIIRPGIAKVIQQDIKLLKKLTVAITKKFPQTKRLRLPETVDEFEFTINKELDLRYEASNASLLKRNFKDSTIMHVPQMYWDYCRKNVLVSERIHGLQIDDFAALKAANVDMAKLSKHGVEIFFTQVFRDRFFHADMHPGNVFVNIDDPANPIYCAVDFGIMGTISETDQYYLAKNLLAFFKGDYETMAALHVQSGWVPEDTNVEHLTAAIRTVCEPIYQKPIKEISFSHLLFQLFEVAHQFDMRAQPQLMLLQKTLLHIEGLGRQIDGNINLWETALPVLENWAKERYSPIRLGKKIIKAAPEILQLLTEDPDILLEKIKPLLRNFGKY